MNEHYGVIYKGIKLFFGGGVHLIPYTTDLCSAIVFFPPDLAFAARHTAELYLFCLVERRGYWEYPPTTPLYKHTCTLLLFLIRICTQ